MSLTVATQLLRRLRSLGIALTAVALLPGIVAGQPQKDSTGDDLSQLRQRQQELSRRYRELDNKLFSLYRFEQNNDPARAKLLERAFLQSQQNMTADRLAAIVEQLEKSQLQGAQDQQDQVLNQLESLLQLLQSGDPVRQLRDRRERLQALAQQVDRILLLQQGLEKQNQEGQDTDRLARSQAQAAGEAEQAQSEAADLESGPTQPATDPADPSKSPASPAATLTERLQQARQRMQQATEQLKQQQRNPAGEEMRQAIEALREAQRELREVLQQLREEEITQTLEQLENRFRRILQLQVRVNQSTQDLARRPENRRGGDFQVRSGRLGEDQQELALEVGQAQLLLQEDGSSVAIPAIVTELERDMSQVAQRLRAARINEVTLSLQEDIVESLNLLIESLQDARERQTAGNRPPGSPPGASPPSAQPLVSQISELKMLRGLQQRILRRHQRYAQLLPDPQDPLGLATDPDLVAALQRLAETQQNLTELTRGLIREAAQ